MCLFNVIDDVIQKMQCHVELIKIHAVKQMTFIRSTCYNAVKDKDYCLMEIIKGLTDKGQFQYLAKLMGPQEGTYLYGTQFHSLR